MRAAKLTSVITLLIILPASPVVADLVLNEALSAPATDWNQDGELSSRDDEWVEILNNGPSSEQLDGVFLRDGTGETFHFGFSGSLAAGEALVVYGGDAVSWQADNGAGSSGLSLNNSGDHLELLRVTSDPLLPEILDAVDIPSHAAAADRALGRAPGGGAWILYDSMSLYGGSAEPGSTGCEPSPGTQNLCGGIVSTVLSSLSALKASYGLKR